MSIDYDQCKVCTTQQAETFSPDFDGAHQRCPRCGEFKITGTVNAMWQTGLGDDRRARLSGWVREQNQAGSVPTITSNNFESILARPMPSVAERAVSLLIEAGRGLNHLGEGFNINDPKFLAATYSANSSDVNFLLRMLSEQRLAEATEMGGWCEILPDGYMRLDELKMQVSSSSQGFIAMWFNDDLNHIYTAGFEIGVFHAGYDPIRVDRVEHINKIDDEIINQINSSKFVVADFTGHRGGVYFEAGYAMGIGLPVFWTCRKDDLSELHFDIRQFNCIDWESPEELAVRLGSRIEAVVGPGPNRR